MKPKYPRSLTDPDFNLHAYQRDLVQTLAEEIFKIIHTETKSYGPEFGSDVTGNLLTTYIATIVYHSLSLPPEVANTSHESQYEVTTQQFAQLKQMVQLAVGEGFSRGFQAAYSSTIPPEYQCEISCIDAGIDNGVKN